MPRKVITFTGSNGAGNVTVTGAVVGDKVAALTATAGAGITLGADDKGIFSPFVTTADTLRQNAGNDFSGVTFEVLLERTLLL